MTIAELKKLIENMSDDADVYIELHDEISEGLWGIDDGSYVDPDGDLILTVS